MADAAVQTMRVCRVCGVPLMPGNHTQSQVARHNYICHVCKGEKDKLYKRGRPSAIESSNRWRRENPEKARLHRRTSNHRWRAKPDTAAKTQAHHKVETALRAGRLVRPAQCGGCGLSGRIQAHHDDYARQLDVMWLCQGCHVKRHRFLAAGQPSGDAK